jgi:hypothetical protein
MLEFLLRKTTLKVYTEFGEKHSHTNKFDNIIQNYLNKKWKQEVRLYT